jgi:hypothetical protein
VFLDRAANTATELKASSYADWYYKSTSGAGNAPVEAVTTDDSGKGPTVIPTPQTTYECKGTTSNPTTEKLDGETGDIAPFTGKPAGTKYSDNTDCRWHIKSSVEGALTITLSFTSLSTESGWDFVEVYDGDKISSKRLLKASGTTKPSDVTSTGNNLLVRFTADSMINKVDGFKAKFTVNKAGPKTKADDIVQALIDEELAQEAVASQAADAHSAKAVEAEREEAKSGIQTGDGMAGLPGWAIALIVIGAVVVIVGVGFFGYRQAKKGGAAAPPPAKM